MGIPKARQIMAVVEVRLGDVVALVAPDGTRCRYMVSTLTDATGVRHELSDHCEGSAVYDTLLNERTVMTLEVRQ